MSNRVTIHTTSSGGGNSKVKIDAIDTTADYLANKIVAGTGISLSILNSGGNEQLQINSTASSTLAHTQIAFGDPSNVITSSADFIYDTSAFIFNVGFSGSNFFRLDPLASLYQFGDISNINNGSMLTIDDSQGSLDFSSFGSSHLNLDAATAIYQIGEIGGTQITINDSALAFSFTISGQNYLLASPGSQFYGIGDLDGNNNLTRIILDDSGEVIYLNAVNSIAAQTQGDFYVTDGSNTPFDVTPSSNQVYINHILYPQFDGSSGQAIVTDGSGNLSFASIGVTIGGTISGGVPYDVITADGSGNLIQYDDFYYNADTLEFFVGFTHGVSGADYLDINAGSNIITVATSGQFNITDGASSEVFSANPITGSINVTWGDIGAVGNNTVMELDDANENFTMQQNGFQFLNLDGIADQFQMGDISGRANGQRMNINDSSGITDFYGGLFRVNDVSGAQYFEVDAGGGVVTIGNSISSYSLPLSRGSFGYVLTQGPFGDTSFAPPASSSISIGTAIGSSTPYNILFIDGSSNLGEDSGFYYQNVSGGANPFQFNVSLNGTHVLNTDMTAGTAKLGNYAGGGVGNTSLTMDFGTTGNVIQNAFGKYTIVKGSGTYLSIDPTTSKSYQIGDISSITNGTFLNVDDTNSQFSFSKNKFKINGVTWNFPTSHTTNGFLYDNGSGALAEGTFSTGLSFSAGVLTASSTNAQAHLTGQTAAVTGVTTFTVGASNAMFSVGGYVTITAVTLDVINLQVTYTDETSTSRTQSFFQQGLTSANLSTVGSFPFPPMYIRAKAGTSISINTTLVTGTGTIAYDVGAAISQI